MLLLAPVARAEGPEPAWSLGSGIGFSLYSAGSIVGLPEGCCGYSAVSAYAPAPQIGIERRLSPSTSLFFDLIASVGSTSATAATLANYGSAVTASSSFRVGGLLGVRQLLTDPGAAVAVALFGGLNLGYARVSQEVVSKDSGGVQTTSRSSAHQLGLGVGGGLSVEKSLAERLSLRLAARLLSAGYTKSAASANDEGPWSDSSGFSAQLGFDPAIELRLAF